MNPNPNPHPNPHPNQVVLLVHTLAKAHGVRFSAHGLVPMGSFSRVYRLDEPKARAPWLGLGLP